MAGLSSPWSEACTTPAPATTTTTTTTAAPTYCRGEVRSVSSAQCLSLNGNYTVCYSDAAYQNQVSATFLSCVGSSATTTVAPTTTTTTAAPSTNRNCNSFDVANEMCFSTGCSSGTCASGSVCSTNVQYRCTY